MTHRTTYTSILKIMFWNCQGYPQNKGLGLMVSDLMRDSEDCTMSNCGRLLIHMHKCTHTHCRTSMHRWLKRLHTNVELSDTILHMCIHTRMRMLICLLVHLYGTSVIASHAGNTMGLRNRIIGLYVLILNVCEVFGHIKLNPQCETTMFAHWLLRRPHVYAPR